MISKKVNNYTSERVNADSLTREQDNLPLMCYCVTTVCLSTGIDRSDRKMMRVFEIDGFLFYP